MKAPLSWLESMCPSRWTCDETRLPPGPTGTEVERVTEVGVPGGGENLQHFVVGKVLECRRHPDADKLSVCMVDVGEASTADHRLRGAQRGGGTDGGRGPSRRGHARRHPHPRSQAARRRHPRA